MSDDDNNTAMQLVNSTMSDGQRRLWLMCSVALLLTVTSALAVIYSSFKSRQLFDDLQSQSRLAMHLEEEWGRLLLEQSTWASHERIERLAKSRLNMVIPDPTQIIVIEQ